MNRLFFICILLSSLVCGCGRKYSGDPRYMAFENVVYVGEFPRRADLTGTLESGIDVIGIQDFAVCDSITIAVTNDGRGFWTLLSSDDYTELGRYLMRGNGPNEFSSAPHTYQSSFIESDGDLCAIMPNSAGRLYKMNISATLRNDKLVMEPIRDSISDSVFATVYINDSTLLCREINWEETHQNRYFLIGGRRSVPRHLEILNDARVDRGEDFNIISSIIKYNAKNDRIVEMPVDLNTLSIYSPDGSFAVSTCFGDKVDNIVSIQNRPKGRRIYTYSALRLYDDFIAALYSGIPRAAYGISRPSPQIHLFDWNGNPLAEICLSEYATTFDIDFDKRRLYALNPDSEQMYRYDISGLLSELMP